MQNTRNNHILSYITYRTGENLDVYNIEPESSLCSGTTHLERMAAMLALTKFGPVVWLCLFRLRCSVVINVLSYARLELNFRPH